MPLKSRRMVPPGGQWKYNVPPLIVGGTFDELVNKVEAFFRSNGASDDEIASVEFLVEDQICHNWPQGCQAGTISSMTILEAQKEFKAALKNLNANGFVSQQEAERRAQICLTCHNHVKNGAQVQPRQGGCKACSKATQLLDSVLWNLGLKAVDLLSPALREGRVTQYDNRLGQCSLCGCLLKLAIWVKNEAGGFADKRNMFPTFCWKKD